MKKLFVIAFVFFCGLAAGTFFSDIARKGQIHADKTPSITTNPTKYTASSETKNKHISFMKDVGEAYMDHFGLTDEDFQILKNARIDVIEGNFDICAAEEDVQYFLDRSSAHGMKVVMPAGAGEAEWSYACDQETYPKDQKPVWNKKDVTDWVNIWKNHPAVYAWDISNEAGSVLPNASWYNEKDSHVPDAYYISAEQLKIAYKDLKTADPAHPIMIRMNGWFFYDYDTNFFRNGNPFAANIADIVMVNAYSNVEDYYPDFVNTVTNRAQKSIAATDPKAKIIISLGIWKEEPLWKMPTTAHLKQELTQLQNRTDLAGIAYFKYGAKNSTWYLPDATTGAPILLEMITNNKR